MLKTAKKAHPRATKRVVGTVSETDITVSLPSDLLDDLLARLESRGSDLNSFVAVAARSYLRMPSEFTLDTPLPFPRYSGEYLETIIRLDPGYIRWLLENRAGFRIDEIAMKLLDKLDPQ